MLQIVSCEYNDFTLRPERSIFNLIFGAFSRFSLYLFGKEAAKKDAASIGAKIADLSDF